MVLISLLFNGSEAHTLNGSGILFVFGSWRVYWSHKKTLESSCGMDFRMVKEVGAIMLVFVVLFLTVSNMSLARLGRLDEAVGLR